MSKLLKIQHVISLQISRIKIENLIAAVITGNFAKCRTGFTIKRNVCDNYQKVLVRSIIEEWCVISTGGV